MCTSDQTKKNVSEKAPQKCQLYSPFAFGAVAVALLAVSLTSAVPLGGGLSFWSKLLPQIWNLSESVNIPDFERPHTSNHTANLVPLPTVISGKDPNWREYLASSIHTSPVVVRGLMYSEAARFGNVSTMNFETFKEIYGDYEVSAFTHMTKDKSAIKMKYSDYHKRMTEGEELYARAVPDLGFLTQNVDLEWLASLLGKSWSLWLTLISAMGGSTGGNLPLSFIGSEKVSSQAHSDIGTSIFLMVQGRKRWLFWSPTETPYMYPYGQQCNVAYNAGVNVFKPDFEMYPEFQKASGYEVTLQPGDVLFFPSMWWHAVQNLDRITIGTDVPMIDILGSWQRNSIFTACSLLNPRLMMNMVNAAWKGLSMREIFFQGYVVDDDKK
eukprot:TRINITY_DN19533_c0_g1_i4.p1 TRINITY_DN19533_c0_g1~~TRINITY_DN19533_c0_g1_i4.p1  ORF type:complete len:383 (-),score=66.10 TRINITY_DN19533_c0_g1_i4:34-1182(-)